MWALSAASSSPQMIFQPTHLSLRIILSNPFPALVSPLFSPHFSPPVSSVVTVTSRRSTLPSPSPTSSVSLWNILRNNIGKDLSKVAMPVQLNEPLNTLQRFCEELEYSELLDRANQTQDPYQRMVRGKTTRDNTASIKMHKQDGALYTCTNYNLKTWDSLL